LKDFSLFNFYSIFMIVVIFLILWPDEKTFPHLNLLSPVNSAYEMLSPRVPRVCILSYRIASAAVSAGVLLVGRGESSAFVYRVLPLRSRKLER